MFKLLNAIFISATVLIATLIILDKINSEEISISAYFNTQGAFAGFVQKKNGSIRACEFSSHGTVLSCSKWFKDDNLKQGENYGIEEEEI